VLIARSLIAWAVGSFVGCFALLGERLFGDVVLSAGGLGAYALAGGAVATLSRSILAPVFPAPAARAGAVTAIAAFGALHALRHLNVRVLPGEHFLAGKSLAFDLVVAAPLLVVSVLVSRARWAQRVRERWGHWGAVLGAAALVGGLFLVVSGAPAQPREVEPNGEGPNVLVVVLDSLRADRLPAAGAHPATPALSRLARQGRVFASAWAASSWTVPSVATILGSDPTLPQVLSARGYRTACFTDNPHLSIGRKIVRGFDRVERSVRGWRAVLVGTALGELVERVRPGSDSALATKAIAWATEREGPFFLYVQLMDSHTPYRFAPLDGARYRGRRVEFPYTGMRLTPDEAHWIRARYDGGVHSADAAAARLVAAVASLRRPFVAVITSDHGESLGEDGRWFHGMSLSNELVAVPLVVLGDGVTPAVVETPVGHSAITRTVLAAAGAPCGQCDEPDLRFEDGRGIAQGSLPPHLAYRIQGRHKLLLDSRTGSISLHDVVSDPGDQRDLSPVEPDLARSLAAGLAATPLVHQPAPELRERLRSLGYTAPGP
jgi:hypothetical protein